MSFCLAASLRKQRNGGLTMKIFKIAFLAFVLAISLCAVGNANAQNLQRGEIRGFVYDSSHALVPVRR